MKKTILVGLLVFSLAARAQPDPQQYYDAQPKFGDLSGQAHTSPFSVIDHFNITSPPGSMLGGTTIHVTGEAQPSQCRGQGCVGTFSHTSILQTPLLLIARPALDASGNQIYTADAHGVPVPFYTDVGPALDVNGNLVTFQYAPFVNDYEEMVDHWFMAAKLPAGVYNLKFSGTSCSLRNCTGVGGSYFYVSTSVEYTQAPSSSSKPGNAVARPADPMAGNQ